MRRQTVTLKDVARAANVSPSTASEALSGGGRMTAATRESVVRAAQVLNYRPNAVARGLRTGQLKSIAVHHVHSGDRFASDYFRDFVTGVLDGTQADDYDLTLLNSNPQVPRNRVPRVDGVIIADPIADDLRAHELLNSGLPVVAGENLPPGMPACPVVAADHGSALREILDHALARGVRRPALLGPDANSGWGEVLRAEFTAWCAAHGLRGATRRSRFGNPSVPEHEAQVDELLTAEPGTDLLIVSSEPIALGALAALRTHGRSPGTDVLLACCAESRVLSATSPAITGVDMRPRELGRECARLLIRMLGAADVGDGGDAPPAGPVTLPTTIHWRASTGPRDT
ncbi:LacI family DNA-binding transcriptional regulator [Streptomyces sp. NPDC049879]|uniref:LacI family DNA-binding transcriptional regulator n=1 Tax=Streptomyces sp. NPDC049879 TaxID=3365598 RepID=UPI00379E6CA6